MEWLFQKILQIAYKYFCDGNLLSKVAASGIAKCDKRNHRMSYLANFAIFFGKLLSRTPPGNCFWKLILAVYLTTIFFDAVTSSSPIRLL